MGQHGQLEQLELDQRRRLDQRQASEWGSQLVSDVDHGGGCCVRILAVRLGADGLPVAPRKGGTFARVQGPRLPEARRLRPCSRGEGCKLLSARRTVLLERFNFCTFRLPEARRLRPST